MSLSSDTLVDNLDSIIQLKNMVATRGGEGNPKSKSSVLVHINLNCRIQIL